LAFDRPFWRYARRRASELSASLRIAPAGAGFSRDAFELSVGAGFSRPEKGLPSVAMLLFDIPTKSIGPEDPPAKSRSDGAGFDDGSRVADSLQERVQPRCL
jgi:hypothetical protein